MPNEPTLPTADEIRALVRDGVAVERLEALHPADQGEVLESLDDDEAVALLSQMSLDRMAGILNYLEEEPRQRLTRALAPDVLASVVDRLRGDVAADVIQELPPDQLSSVLARMGHREEVADLLQYDEESAGGLMSPDVLALGADWTVQRTIEFLRGRGLDQEQPYYLYVVDDGGRLLGVVSLRKLIVSDPDTVLRDIMSHDVKTVSVDADQEAVAEKMRHYNFLSLPVVDAEGRLKGMVTADDILDVQVEEATEDMYLQAGLQAHESVLNPVLVSVRNRTPWLLLNLVTAFLAGLLVTAFQDTIAKVAILAAFMPIIAGHGGNTGTQAATLVVRGLALGEVSLEDAWRIAMKSVAFGLINGVLAGSLTAGLALVLSNNHWLALVVFVAMLGNLVIAALAGALIPLAFRKLDVDPALASTIWLTTFTDICGFFLLLGLGTALITRLS